MYKQRAVLLSSGQNNYWLHNLLNIWYSPGKQMAKKNISNCKMNDNQGKIKNIFSFLF